jgi:hypothetical protein
MPGDHRFVRAQFLAFFVVFVFLLSASSSSWATTWYVSPSGSSTNTGTQASPWDISSALNGSKNSQILPGDTIYLLDGTYVGDRAGQSGNLWVKLNGTASQRITICPAPGAHPWINGGLAIGQVANYGYGDVLTPSNYVDIKNLELAVTGWMPDVTSTQTGPWPSDVPTPAGGILLYAANYCRVINCVIHAAAEGMESWKYDVGMEAYGNIIYGCGWHAPDRGHGHCIYTQNLDPNGKFYRDNILSTRYPDGSNTVQAYGTGSAGTDHYHFERNIAIDGGEFLVGGGGPSDDEHIISNIIYGCPLWAGYVFSSYNVTYEVANNYMVNQNMNFWKIENLTDSNNVVINGDKLIYVYPSGTQTIYVGPPTPTTGATVFVNPNAYDSTRANVVIFNWGNTSTVAVNLQGVVAPGAGFRLVDPKNFYAPPVWSGVADATSHANIPTPNTFNLFVLLPPAGNLPPVVNAGADQALKVPATATTLSGTVSDDGLPTGATVTHTWTQVSGPSATIVSPGSLSTSIALSNVGTYVFRLTASDTALASSDDINVVLSVPVNLAPLVNAGADQSINLPANSITLTGTVSDDGLPTGSTVTHTWSQISGPTATIANPTALSTSVTLGGAGTYDFRLTASDTALSSYDDMIVVVNNPAASAALHLSFDEGSGTVAHDSSGSGHNGTLTGSPLPSWLTTGPTGFNDAIQFDGAQNYVGVNSFSVGPEFTLAFWFNPLSSLDANHGGYHYLFSWGAVGTQSSINVWFTTASEGTSGASIRTLAADVSGANLSTNPPWNGGDTLDVLDANHVANAATYHWNDGKWHHYALTFSATTGRTVYVDGNALISDMKDVGHAIVPAGNLYIGARQDLNSSRFYGGGVDDLYLFNRVMDANGVKALMAPVVVNTAPTVSISCPSSLAAPLNKTITLTGIVSDDGLPTPPSLTYAWTQVSGPAPVVFLGTTSASTIAGFPNAGVYVVRLTASDGQLTGHADATITVTGDLRADFNGDGRVDGVDFLIWQSHYPTASGATFATGDANGDGKVDGVDFLAWQSCYGVWQ